MTNAPERIWIEDEFGEGDEDQWNYGTWDVRNYRGYVVEYVRADIVQALTAERDRLREALEVADKYLHVLQTVNSEPLNSLNQSKGAGQYIAGIRNDAREIWAIIGNVMHLGFTVSEARAALKGETP